MPASDALALFEGNTDTITTTVKKAVDQTPEDITGATVEVFFKTSASTADSDPSTVTISTPTDVEITDGPNGIVMFNVPAEAVAAPVSKFWRLDVVNGSSRRTASYGPVTITDL